MAATPEEAVKAAQSIGGNIWVVKAQIHAGGRGKGGGIKVAKTLDDVRSLAQKMLGMNLVTPQTGDEVKRSAKFTLNKVATSKKNITSPLSWIAMKAAW